jgi:hypothetical protein
MALFKGEGHLTHQCHGGFLKTEVQRFYFYDHRQRIIILYGTNFTNVLLFDSRLLIIPTLHIMIFTSHFNMRM